MLILLGEVKECTKLCN